MGIPARIGARGLWISDGPGRPGHHLEAATWAGSCRSGPRSKALTGFCKPSDVARRLVLRRKRIWIGSSLVVEPFLSDCQEFCELYDI